MDTGIAALIVQICRERYGENRVFLSDVMGGGPDAKFLHEVCDCVYCFSSFYKPGTASKAHMVNESMDIGILTDGPAFYLAFLTRYSKRAGRCLGKMGLQKACVSVLPPAF